MATAAHSLASGVYVWDAGHHATRSPDGDPVTLDDGLLVALDQPLTVLGDDDASQDVEPFSGFPIDSDEPILPLADGAEDATFLLIGLSTADDASEREPFDESPAPADPFPIAVGDYVLAVLSVPENDVDDLLASDPMRDVIQPVFIVTTDDLDLDAALPGSRAERQTWIEADGVIADPAPSASLRPDADPREPVWLIALVPAPDESAFASGRSATAAPGTSSMASPSPSTQPSGSASPTPSPSASPSASVSASPAASPSPVASTAGSGTGPGSVEVIRTGPSLTDLLDTDDDGLTLAQERDESHTDPSIADTDGDGLLDGNEVAAGCSPLVQDTDADGLNDTIEAVLYRTSCRQADTDADGLTDSEELFGPPLSSDPLAYDTDGDGLGDSGEYDYGTDPRDTDWDSDGLSDSLDILLGLSPKLADTDADCVGDGTEYLSLGTNPLSPDSDGDGYGDYTENYDGTNPLNAEDYASDHGPLSAICSPSAPQI